MRKNIWRIKRKVRSFYDHFSLIPFGSSVNTRFIILTSPRSGSNLLSNHLRIHKNIMMHSEIFNLFAISRTELDSILINPRSYLKDILEKRSPPSINTLGFKIFYSQANELQLSPDLNLALGIPEPGDDWRKKISGVQDYVNQNYDNEKIAAGFRDVWTLLEEDTSIKVIHLIRENKLKQFLSLYRASVTDVWKSYDKKTLKDTPVSLQYEDCLNFFKKYTSWEHEFDELFYKHDKISITYEEFVKNKIPVLKKVQNFLNVPLREDLSTGLVKQRGGSLSETIFNYRELKSNFKNSEWEHFFED
ncbi:MAG: sulfotransferase domain-containing protein [Desulfosarcina sp.]|nr:sulfotransferase domain-containing protein [Desulfosarcina sp.]